MTEPTNKWLRWECETCRISWDIQMPGFPGSGLDEGMHAHVVYEQNQLDWTCFGPITAQLIPPPRPLKSSHLDTPLGVHPQRTPERTPAPSVSAQPSQTPPPLCSPSLFLPAKVSDTREKRNQQVARCADVEYDETAEQRPWYDAEVGDHIWTFGKAGGNKNTGHVVTKLASCAEDARYCDLEGYRIECEHRLVPMCECGDMWLLDHHSVVMKPEAEVARHEEPEDCTAALCSEHEATEEPPYPRCPAWTWLDAPDQPQRCLRLVRHTGDHRWWP